MTTAYERTKSVIETREFLRQLAASDAVVTRTRIRMVAARLLRHYPLDIDLELSAAALPGVWAAPQH
ncbi:BPSL0761 family protein [Burkholderia lata]|uniref:BPSL0761 family protein n=1 Tax=Burkholderia lata (strain ATCC 17760 / DSM 23089 / LMG 22485 / NCIMB 9086 / R18194 / 383) TaxID=482957 RepID=UPI00311960AD